ncbi:MAG: H-X9-DG-CTERM domain-containing protein [Candidatus Puniceispirillaceae bacterium]
MSDILGVNVAFCDSSVKVI